MKVKNIQILRGTDIIKNGPQEIVSRKTGNTKLLKNYFNNILHGEYTYYWDNGKTRFKGEYKYGQRDGLWLTYNKLGELIAEEYFSYVESKSSDFQANFSQLERQLVGNALFHN